VLCPTAALHHRKRAPDDPHRATPPHQRR